MLGPSQPRILTITSRENPWYSINMSILILVWRVVQVCYTSVWSVHEPSFHCSGRQSWWIDRHIVHINVIVLPKLSSQKVGLWKLTQVPQSLFNIPPQIKFFLDPLHIMNNYKLCKFHSDKSKIVLLDLRCIWYFSIEVRIWMVFMIALLIQHPKQMSSSKTNVSCSSIGCNPPNWSPRSSQRCSRTN